MSINPPPANNLGVIVTSTVARRWIYGVYVVAGIIAGAVAVFFANTHYVAPDWFSGAGAVLQYLGIPVGTIAIANTLPVKPAPIVPSVDPTALGGD